MQSPRVVIAASANVGDIARLWKRIEDRWPAHAPRPRVERMSLAKLLSEEWSADAPPLLAVLSPADAGTTAFKVVDLLQSTLAPGIVLFPTLREDHRVLAGGGVLIDSVDADPTFLAAALYALTERQVSVSSIANEMELTARFQGGMRGEMDRLHEELHLAAMVQQELLPKQLPEAEGFQFGVLFRPASYVSGDIYGLSRLDDNRIAFFIADAVGHGVPAALLTVVIARSLPSGGPNPWAACGIEPGDALTRLNMELSRLRRESPRFATAIYGYLDLRTREVTFACAGHPPPLIMGSGKYEKVDFGGPLLGVFDEETYEQTTIRLEPGQTFLLHSDGFETAFPEPGVEDRALRKGTDRYLRQVANLPWPDGHNDMPLATAMGKLAEGLDEQAGSLHQADDITALVIAPQAVAVSQAQAA